MQSSGAQGSAKQFTQQFTVYLRRDKTTKKAASKQKNAGMTVLAPTLCRAIACRRGARMLGQHEG